MIGGREKSLEDPRLSSLDALLSDWLFIDLSNTYSSVEGCPLVVACGYSVLIESVEIAQIEGNEEAKESQEKVACEVVEHAEEPTENIGVLEYATRDLLDFNLNVWDFD